MIIGWKVRLVGSCKVGSLALVLRVLSMRGSYFHVRSNKIEDDFPPQPNATFCPIRRYQTPDAMECFGLRQDSLGTISLVLDVWNRSHSHVFVYIYLAMPA